VIAGDDWPTPDGTCVRDYVHVEDLARAHVLALAALDSGVSGAMNLGTAAGQSVREVFSAAEKVTGKRIPVRVGPRRPRDPATLVADARRAARELGWRPGATLEDILRSAWTWMGAHPNGYQNDEAGDGSRGT